MVFRYQKHTPLRGVLILRFAIMDVDYNFHLSNEIDLYSSLAKRIPPITAAMKSIEKITSKVTPKSIDQNESRGRGATRNALAVKQAETITTVRLIAPSNIDATSRMMSVFLVI